MEETLFKDQLNCVNTRLKVERIGVTIVKKGNRLYLRGTFPPRPGSTKSRPHQQEIALGLLAKAEELFTAEKEARKVGGLLALGEFDWKPLLRHAPKDEYPCSTTRARVKQEAEEQGEREQGETTTVLVLRPSNELIVECYHQLTAWAGQRAWAFGILANYGLRSHESFEDWVKQEAGEQGEREQEEREQEEREQGETTTVLVLRPSNELIVECYHRLPASARQRTWAFSVLASYGFRSQELLSFRIALGRFKSDNGVLTVGAGKTGARQTWPVHREWVEQFSLLGVKVPQCTGKRGRDCGQRILQYFWQNNIPFRPYDLRPCWVIRSIHWLGYFPGRAANGHSAIMPSQTYQAGLAFQHHQQACERMLTPAISSPAVSKKGRHRTVATIGSSENAKILSKMEFFTKLS